MFKFFCKITLVFLPFFYLFYCQSAQPLAETKERPVLYLAVSSKMKALYPFMQKTNYQDKEIDQLFDTLTVKGNEFCKMLYGMKKFDYTKAKRFIDSSQLSLFQRKSEKGTIYTLMAGCWNFFVLNDAYPNRDFKLVKKLYPREQFDCFSVGMLQPYMMHNALSCKTLTMLDIDWRILDGHRQMLKLYNKKTFSGNGDIDSLLSKMSLGWIAFSNPFVDEQPVNLQILCQRHQHDMCKHEMALFQKTYESLNAIHFNLAGLHDGNYLKSGDKNTIVVFLSNAIENYYCTQKQFDQIIEKIRLQLKPNEKALLIYHVGGRPQMGIYELVRKDKAYAINTVCKDVYLSDNVGGKKIKVYNTYLEKVSNTKGSIPACRDLQQKMKI